MAEMCSNNLESKNSRACCTSGQWQIIKCGDLKEVTGWSEPLFESSSSFGVGNRLWLRRRPPSKQATGDQIFSIYDLPTGKLIRSIKVKTRSYVDRPGIRILPRTSLLLGDVEQIRLLSWDGEEIHDWKQDGSHAMLRSRPLFCEDSIITQNVETTKGDGSSVSYTFYDNLDKWHMSDKTLEMPEYLNLNWSDNPYRTDILKKDNFVMVHHCDGLAMFDLKAGKQLWEMRDLGWGQLPLSQIFLTNTFCGLVYIKETTNRAGRIKLLLFDLATGALLLDKQCWEFIGHIGSDLMPTVLVKGKYLFVYSQHVQDIKEGSSIMCVKVDEDGSCLVRSASHDLEYVLDASCSGCEITNTDQPYADINVRLQKDSFQLLGYAFESVVVGYLAFIYYREWSALNNIKVLFSVDLNVILNEPADVSAFKAIHFPLDPKKLLVNYSEGKEPPVPQFYPYYQDKEDNDETMLSGILMILEEAGKVITRLYSFQNTLERQSFNESPSTHEGFNKRENKFSAVGTLRKPFIRAIYK